MSETPSILPLVTKRIRVRINCLGVVDALEYEARTSLVDLQRNDLRDLGHVILSLATGCPKFIEPSLLSQYEGFMRQQNYSSKLCDITMALLTLDFAPVPSIDHVSRWLVEYTFDEMDAYHAITDTMDETLSTEFESSRVLRLMMKLAFVNERPEFGVDPRWSESGDNYVLKLFRDYGRSQIWRLCKSGLRSFCLNSHVLLFLMDE
jgi:PAB-dependent poly(A)-specific ribonuclease subunit 3